MTDKPKPPPTGQPKPPPHPIEPPEPPVRPPVHPPVRPPVHPPIRPPVHPPLQPTVITIDPAPSNPPQPPGTPSITSWTRLEPHCRDSDMRSSTGARVFDPLWFITRQWQVGEFQAEDAGSPVLARVRATSATLTRLHMGELAPNTETHALPYDPLGMPLEARIERRRMRAADPNDPRLLALAVEAGLHFLRMLDAQPMSKSYRAAFAARFALQPMLASPVSPDENDEATVRFMQTMTGRAPDARRLAAAFRTGSIAQMLQDRALEIDAGDRAEVQQAALAWLAWYDALVSEPADAGDEAWIASRMEYAVSIAGRISEKPEDEITLTAAEFDDGRLDWSSFDRNVEVNMGTDGDRSLTAITETTVPAPVTFHGAPAARFWEMEDARIAYGLVPVGPTDLAQLMMIEYASSYGNDWFVIPLTLPVGSLTTVDSLVVTDTFGVRSLLRPIGDRTLPPANWSMWQMAYARRPGSQPIAVPNTNLFFLPPSLGRVIEGSTLEDVLVHARRDGQSRVGDRAVHGESHRAVASARACKRNRRAAWHRHGFRAGQRHAALPPFVASAGELDSAAAGAACGWTGQGHLPVAARCSVAARRLDEECTVRRATSSTRPPELLLYDEEVPREGVHVTRNRRMARWIDGSTWVWTAFRKQVGRGEGSSGLRFDSVTRDDDKA